MPDSLWESAVEVAGRLGVSAVSRAAGLSYYGLRSRLSAAETSRVSRPQFVELRVPGFEADAGVACELEVQRPDGARLTLRRPRVADVSAVVSAFLGGRPCSS
jgi:hypothetical protein